jgi:hypothetical protein
MIVADRQARSLTPALSRLRARGSSFVLLRVVHVKS